MSYIVGIDPGLSGAVAFLKGDDATVFPMPLVPLSDTRNEIDSLGLAATLQKHKGIALVVLELVGGDPKFGGSRAFNFGKGYGQVLAVLHLLGVNYIRVRPQDWKKTVLTGTDKSKEAAISFVQRRYPKVNLVLPGSKKPSHDLAEAICLAHFGKSVK